MKTIAVLLYGGTGTRVGREMPKQFIQVCGKTILEYTVEKFEKHSLIDLIIIVSNEEFIGHIKQIVCNNGWNKVSMIITGGKERSDSSLAAIRACKSIAEDAYILIHDGVRPLVTERIITEVIYSLKYSNSVNVVFPVRDTIIDVRNNTLYDVPNRSTLYVGQSPQGFKLSTLTEAFRRARQDKHFRATDDCGVVRKYLPNETISIVIGDENNLKLTYESDLLIIEHLLSKG